VKSFSMSVHIERTLWRSRKIARSSGGSAWAGARAEASAGCGVLLGTDAGIPIRGQALCAEARIRVALADHRHGMAGAAPVATLAAAHPAFSVPLAGGRQRKGARSH